MPRPTRNAWIAVCLTMLLMSLSSAYLIHPHDGAPAFTFGINEGDLQVNVTDNAGRPIADANITITGNVSYWHTLANGTVVIKNLSIGQHYVNASMDGYITDPSNPVTIVDGALSFITLVVQGETLNGFVFSKDNNAIPGANVSIFPHPWWASSSATGAFSLVGIPTGNYTVSASSAGYSPGFKQVQVTVGVPVSPVFFKLNYSLGSISGHVSDGTSPLSNVTVSIVVNQITLSISTNSIGYYQIPGITTGNYTVTATKTGYADAVNSTVHVTNGSETIVDFNLTGLPARLFGTVTTIITAGSVLVYGVTVEIVELGRNDTTDAQGSFEILDVPVGKYTIRAFAAGYNTTTIPNVDFERGASVRMDIDLIPLPGQLTGVVRATDTYVPLSGFRVTISGPMQMETVTNENGQYVFAGLSAGNYTITVVSINSTSRYSPFIISGIEVVSNELTTYNVYMTLVKQSLGGFIFGMDLPHSFMVLSFFITIIILTLAAYLRLKKLSGEEKGTPVDVEVEDEPAEEEKKEEPPGQ
jgi:hypothetical protein